MRLRRFLQGFTEHARTLFSNWHEYDAPPLTKLRLGVRNRLRATFSKRQCCGHLGEPGC